MNQIKQNVEFQAAEKSLPSDFVGDSAPYRSYLLDVRSGDNRPFQKLNDARRPMLKTSVEEIFSDFQSDIEQAHNDFLEAMGLLEL